MLIFFLILHVILLLFFALSSLLFSFHDTLDVLLKNYISVAYMDSSDCFYTFYTFLYFFILRIKKNYAIQ